MESQGIKYGISSVHVCYKSFGLYWWFAQSNLFWKHLCIYFAFSRIYACTRIQSIFCYFLQKNRSWWARVHHWISIFLMVVKILTYITVISGHYRRLPFCCTGNRLCWPFLMIAVQILPVLPIFEVHRQLSLSTLPTARRLVLGDEFAEHKAAPRACSLHLPPVEDRSHLWLFWQEGARPHAQRSWHCAAGEE